MLYKPILKPILRYQCTKCSATISRKQLLNEIYRCECKSSFTSRVYHVPETDNPYEGEDNFEDKDYDSEEEREEQEIIRKLLGTTDDAEIDTKFDDKTHTLISAELVEALNKELLEKTEKMRAKDDTIETLQQLAKTDSDMILNMNAQIDKLKCERAKHELEFYLLQQKLQKANEALAAVTKERDGFELELNETMHYYQRTATSLFNHCNNVHQQLMTSEAKLKEELVKTMHEASGVSTDMSE